MVVYSITLLVLLQFARDQLAERQRITALLERSRFARENHALIMQADEESRRRNHEMRHHLQTLQGLLQAGETHIHQLPSMFTVGGSVSFVAWPSKA